MKQGIHPENYRLVAFKDMSNDHTFITRSCVNTKENITIDGVEYPLYKLEISNTSHPFYTGKMKLVDTAGRVDKFRSRYGERKNNGTKNASESCPKGQLFALETTADGSLTVRGFGETYHSLHGPFGICIRL